MKLKNEALWNRAVENNKSAYGKAVITYAQRWAELRKWHNKKYNYQGDEVASPAIVVSGIDVDN